MQQLETWNIHLNRNRKSHWTSHKSPEVDLVHTSHTANCQLINFLVSAVLGWYAGWFILWFSVHVFWSLPQPQLHLYGVVQEREFGPDHCDVATTLSNLGNAYDRLGNIQKQKELLERALAINEREYGRNLRVLLRLKSWYKRCIPCIPQFFNIMAWGWGPDHHVVATTLVNLGSVYGRCHRKKKNGWRFVDMLQVATKVVALISALDILRVILNQVTFRMYFYFHRIHRYHCMISIMIDRLGEHETQRDILERALGIMEAEFGANSHKDGGLNGDDVRVCFLWNYNMIWNHEDWDTIYNAIGVITCHYVEQKHLFGCSIQFSVFIHIRVYILLLCTFLCQCYWWYRTFSMKSHEEVIWNSLTCCTQCFFMNKHNVSKFWCCQTCPGQSHTLQCRWTSITFGQWNMVRWKSQTQSSYNTEALHSLAIPCCSLKPCTFLHHLVDSFLPLFVCYNF